MIRQMCVGILLFLLILVQIRTNATPQSAERQSANNTAAARCPVTPPSKLAPTGEASNLFRRWISHRKPTLYVGLWPDGTVVFQPGGPGSIEPDGSLGMKFPWWRGEGLKGKLRIHGKRLDGPAPALRADIPEGYGDTGFQATGLIFPTEGCWEVTGEVGDTHVTFVTRVVKVGERK
jgi:hypothetical protein